MRFFDFCDFVPLLDAEGLVLVVPERARKPTVAADGRVREISRQHLLDDDRREVREPQDGREVRLVDAERPGESRLALVCARREERLPPLRPPEDLPAVLQPLYCMREIYFSREHIDPGWIFDASITDRVAADFQAIAPVWRLLRGLSDIGEGTYD